MQYCNHFFDVELSRAYRRLGVWMKEWWQPLTHLMFLYLSSILPVGGLDERMVEPFTHLMVLSLFANTWAFRVSFWEGVGGGGANWSGPPPLHMIYFIFPPPPSWKLAYK